MAASRTRHKDNLEALSYAPRRIFFEDECPRIGSGWRTVKIKIGRKWVFFTDIASNIRSRVPIKDAEPIILGSIKRSSR